MSKSGFQIKKEGTEIKPHIIDTIEMLDKIQKITHNENELSVTRNIEKVKKNLKLLI